MDVLERIRQVYTGDDLSLCERAYDYAKKAHANQKRASGEEYFTHPCAVASILIDLGLDAPTIAAAFLHDVIEDTPVSEGDVRQEFGDEVLELVLGVTKLEKIEFTSQEEEQAENFRKIFVAMAKDIRVIIIKLADRLHNMRSLNFLSKERQQRLARETLDIFAPLAGRLGISQIKCELEDLSLKYLEPEFFEFLVVNINQKVKERREFVDFVVKEINGILVESGIEGKVFGRPKHFYSIYKKMKNQHKTLDQIYDLTAVRVIVADVNECYEIFGKIHHKWKPIPGRIKDYIATPKPNMYQSLHTTVVTDFGQIFEIQIRTFEMDRAAEYGIAAHWKYKENKTEADDFDTRLTWIREVMAGRAEGFQGISGFPERGYLQLGGPGVHAEGGRHFSPERRHAHRFCLRHSLRGGKPLRGGEGKRKDGPAQYAAASRRRGGGDHLSEFKGPLLGLAEDRQGLLHQSEDQAVLQA